MWELLRNIGLITFVTGGFVLFWQSIIHGKNSDVLHTEWLRIIADRMMLGGACLAVIAMSLDYLLSDTTTTSLTIP